MPLHTKPSRLKRCRLRQYSIYALLHILCTPGAPHCVCQTINHSSLVLPHRIRSRRLIRHKLTNHTNQFVGPHTQPTHTLRDPSDRGRKGFDRFVRALFINRRTPKSARSVLARRTLTVQSNGGLDATDAVLRNTFVATEIAFLQPPNDQHHLDGVHRVVRFRHCVPLVRYYHFACSSVGKHERAMWISLCDNKCAWAGWALRGLRGPNRQSTKPT